MKKITVFVAIFTFALSSLLPASAAVVATNPTAETYYFGKTYDTYNDWCADAYINIASVTKTDSLDVVINADVHYDESLIVGEDLPTDNWQDALLQGFYYGRLFASVQFIRYNTVTKSTTYKQIEYDVAPDKIVPNDLYDTHGGYTCNTDLLYDANLFFRNEHGLDTNFIINTGRDNGVSVIENGIEVIYKTEVVGVYGYLEKDTDTSYFSYRTSSGDLYVYSERSDLETAIVEQGQQNITDFEKDVTTATGEVIDAIGESFNGLISMLTSMLASVGMVPQLITALFGFFPPEVNAVMGITIGVAVAITIIKLIRG